MILILDSTQRALLGALVEARGLLDEIRGEAAEHHDITRNGGPNWAMQITTQIDALLDWDVRPAPPPCDNCDGSGEVPYSSALSSSDARECPKCKGDGHL